MAETIPGGAYKNPDGTWHDANGKPLSEQAVRRQFQRMEERTETKQEERAQEELAPALPPFPSPVTTVTRPEPPAENVPQETVPAEDDSEEAPKPRSRSRRS